MEKLGFAKNLEQYRGVAPNYDDQSLIHTEIGLMEEQIIIIFDLNRDWVYLTQPETQGRVALINTWRPQILVDAHEMGSQDTFMAGLAREPINKNVDYDLIKWGNVFTKDQGNEFDKKEIGGSTQASGMKIYIQTFILYFAFRGTLGILYEQSRMKHEDGVRRPEGTIQSYKESVHHQYVSTFSNLKTLDTHSKEMYYDYWDGRKFNVSSESKYANRSFVILPTKNHNRLNVLADKLLRQDIEIYQNTESIVANDVLLQNGEVKSLLQSLLEA